MNPIELGIIFTSSSLIIIGFIGIKICTQSIRNQIKEVE